MGCKNYLVGFFAGQSPRRDQELFDFITPEGKLFALKVPQTLRRPLEGREGELMEIWTDRPKPPAYPEVLGFLSLNSTLSPKRRRTVRIWQPKNLPRKGLNWRQQLEETLHLRYSEYN